MRNQVFISYRHESSDHARAVRRLGELLRQAGMTVVLDQFYLEDHPGGPDNGGWPKWCEDCANESTCVLIAASEGWFAAYNNTESPGQGLGAATEASLFRQDLYDHKGNNERIRLAFLHAVEHDKVPTRLRAWHHFKPFDSTGPDGLISWVAGRLGINAKELSGIHWPVPVDFQPDIANRNKQEWPAIVDLLSGKSRERILLFEGGSGVGKSELVRQARDYAGKVGVPVAYIDFKSGTLNTDDVLGLIDLELGEHLPNFSQEKPKKTYSLRKDLRVLRQPVLFIFDSYEDIASNQSIADWLNVQLLADIGSTPAVVVVIAGQKMPNHIHASWRDLMCHFPLARINEFEHWKQWASQRYPRIPENVLSALHKLADGLPSLMVVYCKTIAEDAQ